MEQSAHSGSPVRRQSLEIRKQFRTALVYVVLMVAVAWIAFSDLALVALVHEPQQLVWALIIKDALFVLGGGLLLYWWMSRDRRLLAAQADQTVQRKNAPMLRVLTSLMDLSHKDTGDHGERVMCMAEGLARLAGVPDEALRDLKIGALLHDIGKLAIPEMILRRQGTLSPQEVALIRQHPQFGRDLLEQADFPRVVLDIVYAHHERWDGSGYPLGLRGDQTPLAARVVSIVDAWDALGSDRGYRTEWPQAKVLAYLRDGAGSQFDPELVALFLANFDALKASSEQTRVADSRQSLLTACAA